jgi:hypothetical protein
MNAADVIGYIVSGTYYCPDCTPSTGDDASPIFADSETDSFSHCAECEDLIPEALTEEGREEALEALRAYLVSRSGRAVIVRQWAEELKDYYGPSDAGRTICELASEAAAEAVK